MKVADKIAQGAVRLRDRRSDTAGHRLQRLRPRSSDDVALENYRFWHLDYGATAYYDQLVFKRHETIPPERRAHDPLSE